MLTGNLCLNRNLLRNEVTKLANDLDSNTKSSEQNSLLWREVLQERRQLVDRIKEFGTEFRHLRGQSERIRELENKLKFLLNEKHSREEELGLLRINLSGAGIELCKQKTLVDSLRSQIARMEEEIEHYKSLTAEQEKLRAENQTLHDTLEDLRCLRDDCQRLKNDYQCTEILRKERNIFKNRYEYLKDIETECDSLRLQLEKTDAIKYERNYLEVQVEELGTCISEQEEEIHRLVSHIDHLIDNQDVKETKSRPNDA